MGSCTEVGNSANVLDDACNFPRSLHNRHQLYAHTLKIRSGSSTAYFEVLYRINICW